MRRRERERERERETSGEQFLHVEKTSRERVRLQARLQRRVEPFAVSGNGVGENAEQRAEADGFVVVHAVQLLKTRGEGMRARG